MSWQQKVSLAPVSRVSLFDSVFSRVADRAWTFLSTLRDKSDSASVAALHQLFDNATCEAIDYDTHATSFAYTYFLANYWKACSAFVNASPLLAHRVTDAGCGSGATAVAYLSYLSSVLGSRRWRIEVTFVDRSAAQIEYAMRLLDLVTSDLDNLEIIPKYVKADLRDWGPGKYQSECVLLGHVLTENRRNISKLIQRTCGSARADGDLIIIERSDDSVWDEIRSAVSCPSCCFGVVEERISVPECLTRRTYRSDLTAQYLTVAKLHTSILAALVVSYFDAWRMQDASLLDAVFEQSAEYVEKPFSQPIKGLPAIRRYWREQVIPQRALQLDVLTVAFSDDEAFAEWSAEFVLNGRRKRVKGALILSVTPGARKAHRLREYFRTSEVS